MASNSPLHDGKVCSAGKKPEKDIIRSCDSQHVVVYFKVPRKRKQSIEEHLPILYLHKDCLPGGKSKQFLTECPLGKQSFDKFSSSYVHLFGPTKSNPTKKRHIEKVLEIKDDGPSDLGNPFISSQEMNPPEASSNSSNDQLEDMDGAVNSSGTNDLTYTSSETQSQDNSDDAEDLDERETETPPNLSSGFGSSAEQQGRLSSPDKAGSSWKRNIFASKDQMCMAKCKKTRNDTVNCLPHGLLLVDLQRPNDTVRKSLYVDDRTMIGGQHEGKFDTICPNCDQHFDDFIQSYCHLYDISGRRPPNLSQVIKHVKFVQRKNEKTGKLKPWGRDFFTKSISPRKAQTRDFEDAVTTVPKQARFQGSALPSSPLPDQDTESDLQESSEDEEEGDDQTVADDDKGGIPKELAKAKVLLSPLDTPYYPSQDVLANIVFKRIELILKENNRALSDFDEFDFRIYTANSCMLEQQTIARLSQKESLCLPEKLYLHSEKKACDVAKEKVKKYTKDTVNKCHEKLVDNVRNHSKTLFLIVADEAHWGATARGKPHDTLVNQWTCKDHPNVIVLLVTATPYNLVTENSRLPNERWCAGPPENPRIENSENLKKVGLRKLHHIKWTEGFYAKLKQGIVLSFFIPLPDLKGKVNLYIEPQNPSAHPLLEWKGSHCSEIHPGALTEFYLQGKEDRITLTTVDKKWELVCEKDHVGFVPNRGMTEKSVGVRDFQVLNNFGEGILLLKINRDVSKQEFLSFDSSLRKVVIREGSHVYKDVAGYEIPHLEMTFLMENCKYSEQNEPGLEYLSLNYWMNTMRNEAQEQLIREDRDFQQCMEHVEAYAGSRDDILSAEYSYYILLIPFIRQCRLTARTLDTFLSYLGSATGEYSKKREEFLEKFQKKLKEEIEKADSEKKKNKQRKRKVVVLQPIPSKAFESLLTSLGQRVTETQLVKFDQFEANPSIQSAEDWLYSLFLCMLHLTHEKLDAIGKEVYTKLSEPQQNILGELFLKFKSDLFNIFKEKFMQESETCHIVNSLVLSDFSQLDGRMKVIRVSNSACGNRMYKTLCTARRISSNVDYCFEILRDFNRASLEDAFKEEDKGKGERIMREEHNPKHRLWLRLQPDECSYCHPKTQAKCSCKKKINKAHEQGSIKCLHCSHIHKKITKYTDLNFLPCILILIQKGRVGDTFPQSFDVMDLRLCYNDDKGVVNLSTLVQELGRVCRYVDITSRKWVPYALVGNHLANTLREALKEGTTFYAGLGLKEKAVQLDRKISLETAAPMETRLRSKKAKANKGHYDHGNKEKHPQRLLLEAEPQIGKTGVYLKIIALLNSRVNRTQDESSSDSDEEIDDTDGISHQIEWIYPYWKYMKESKPLRTETTNGKYIRLYGPYEHNCPPEFLAPAGETTNKKRSTTQTVRKDVPPHKCMAYTYKHKLDNCSECSLQFDTIILTLYIKERPYKISVPKSKHYKEVLRRLDKFTLNLDDCEGADAERLLKTWIFIPSCNRAMISNVNLYHTMVEVVDKEAHPCSFVAVLVVREEDFRKYCQIWESTHVILQIPETLADQDNDAHVGGIGFARLAIQKFAEYLNLAWIFVMDDNIPYVYRNEDSGKLNVPLFSVLKHLERQVGVAECQDLPKIKFEPFEESIKGNHHLERFTGTSEKYGIIGIRKMRGAKDPINSFTKTHVSSLVLLNINGLKEKEISYKPWQVFEDLQINNECDNQGLWVCKYNNFLLYKRNLKTWIPRIYIWSDETDISKNPPVNEAENSENLLIKWLRSVYPIECFEVLPVDREKQASDVELGKMLEDMMSDKGKHPLLVINPKVPTKNDVETMLKKLYIYQERVPSAVIYLVLMTLDLCRKLDLHKKAHLERLCKGIFEDGFKLNVACSHNVEHFCVKTLLLCIRGKVKPVDTLPEDLNMFSRKCISQVKRKDEDKRIEGKPLKSKTGGKERKGAACGEEDQLQSLLKELEENFRELSLEERETLIPDVAAMLDKVKGIKSQ